MSKEKPNLKRVKLALALVLPFLMVFSMTAGVADAYSANLISIDQSSSDYALNLKGDTLVYNRLCQFSDTAGAGTVYLNFSAYYDVGSGSSYMIYTLQTYVTADSSNGYYVSGDGNTYWSAEDSMYNPMWFIAEVGTNGLEPINQFQPDNTQIYGSAGTISVGISDTSSTTVCGTNLGSSYSVVYTYKIPESELTPWSMTDSNFSARFYDNQAYNGPYPNAASYYSGMSISDVPSNYMNEVTVFSAGQFSLPGFFGPSHYQVSKTYKFTIPATSCMVN